MSRTNIAIIFGGCSPEYSVSLQSAHAVISHIDTNKYNPILIGISAHGDWYHFHGDIAKLLDDSWCNSVDCRQAVFMPNRTEPQLLVFHEQRAQAIMLDVAFPVLHGKNGEDGTVQGLFELAKLPTVGCGTLCSALCMNKDKAHKIAATAGVRVPQSIVLHKYEDASAALEAADALGYPLFVKPLRAGSSFGITKVMTAPQLGTAIRRAFVYDDQIVIEEMVDGFEVGCAVLGNDELIIGEVDEIELADGFFDFNEKYTLDTSAIHIPARVDADTMVRIKQTAQAIYRALDCSGFARVDMFVTPRGEIVFNEVNTIPGFTTHSRFPNMLKAVGISFEQVITRAIELAVSK